MKRGDLYRVYKPAGDGKDFRVFAVVSRQALIELAISDPGVRSRVHPGRGSFNPSPCGC
jgi:hypothetical protein